MNVFNPQWASDHVFKGSDQRKELDYLIELKGGMYDVVLDIFFPGKDYESFSDDDESDDEPDVIKFIGVHDLEQYIDHWAAHSEIIDVHCGGVRDPKLYKKYLLQVLHDQEGKFFESDAQHSYIVRCSHDSVLMIGFKMFSLITNLACRPPYYN
jgi:hypothetical protein